MIWKEKEWVFHYDAKNIETGEARHFNIGSQVCKMPHATKLYRKLEGLSRKFKESGSSWAITCYGVTPLKEYGYDTV